MTSELVSGNRLEKPARIRVSMLSFAVAALLFCLSGYEVSAQPASTLATSSPSAPTLTDGQILKIVHEANDGEIKAGKMAASKSKNAEVKSFAKAMVTEHEGLNKDGDKLAKKDKIKPDDSDDSRALDQAAKDLSAKLKPLKGAEFDREYIGSQVKDHQMVLDTIDQKLLPNAQDADLKAMLQQARPKVAAHLEHAKKVQDMIK